MKKLRGFEQIPSKYAVPRYGAFPANSSTPIEDFIDMGAAASAVTARSSWGIIGYNEPGPLKSRPNLQGVVRSRIDGGLEYLLDPLPANGLRSPFPCWTVIDESTCELDLDRLPNRRFETLRRLRARLELPRGDGTAWDALLDETDEVIRETIKCAGKLHAMGVGLGLLQPDNLLYQHLVANDSAPSGRLRVLLPDVGFVRVRTTLIPDWMRPDCEFARLWDDSPEKMLARSFVLAKFPEFADRVVGGLERDRPVGLSPKLDVRTLARLIAWLLTGSVVTSIPDRSNAASIVPPFSRAAVWSVLRDALEGRIDSPLKLEQALFETSAGAAKPSQHFVELGHKRVAVVRRRNRRAVVVALSLAVLAGLGAGVALNYQKIPTALAWINSKFTSPPHPALAEFDKAREAKDRDGQIAALDKLDKLELPARDQAARAERRSLTLEDINADGVLYTERPTGNFDPDAIRKWLAEQKKRFDAVYRMAKGADPTADDYPGWYKGLDSLLRP